MADREQLIALLTDEQQANAQLQQAYAQLQQAYAQVVEQNGRKSLQVTQLLQQVRVPVPNRGILIICAFPGCLPTTTWGNASRMRPGILYDSSITLPVPPVHTSAATCSSILRPEVHMELFGMAE